MHKPRLRICPLKFFKKFPILNGNRSKWKCTLNRVKNELISPMFNYISARLQILWLFIFSKTRFDTPRTSSYRRKTLCVWQMWLSLQHCWLIADAHSSSPWRSQPLQDSCVWNLWKKFPRGLHLKRTHFNSFRYQAIYLWHLWAATKKWFVL